MVEAKPHQWTDGGDRVRLLKRIDGKTRTTRDGTFHWPKVGETATAPDWNPEAVCGGGLHFWPWGLGLGEGSDYDIIDDEWIVAEAEPANVVGELDGGWKCKASTVKVIYCGSFAEAMSLVKDGQKRLVQAMSSGHCATNASAGDCATNASSGHYAKNASSGHYAKNASSGHGATNASSGYGAKNASAGDYATNASAGDYAKNASSGHCATNASAGDYATNASAGDYATNASSGHYAKNASSGYGAKNASSGKNSIIACAGLNSRVKMTSGAFALAFLRDDGTPDFVVGRVGENAESNVWYIVRDGKLVKE